MTETAISPADTSEPTASERVESWFAEFTSSIAAGDFGAAADLFAVESYWRDLVSFTWNLTTVEGRDGVRDLLEHTGAATSPANFTLDDPADATDGVTTAWFHFETAVGRGWGLARFIEDDGLKAFTFLTTLDELKDYEEHRGDRRPTGAQHGVQKGRKS